METLWAFPLKISILYIASQVTFVFVSFLYCTFASTEYSHTVANVSSDVSSIMPQNGTHSSQHQLVSSKEGVIPRMPAPDEQVLMERLFKNYHKYSRPVINASLSVLVKFGLTLVQISDMDEVNQVLTINVWLEQEWVDERLTWDPKDYNNLHILRIPCEKLWLPDIVLYNSADDYTTGYMNSKAMVRSDGNVFWPPPAKFRSSCKIDITYFPFDDQTCELKFGSWTYDGFQVDITNRSSTVDLNNYVFSGEWELINVTIRRTEMTYACCIEPYPDVRFTIVIRRKTLYYLFNIIFPCLWLTILSLLGFWLPPDSGEKITLGITVLLAFSVFMLLIAESMPATSEFVPLIGIYLTVTMGMTSLSIILTVFVLQLHHVGPHKRRVPRWLRALVFDFLARIVCMYQNSQTLQNQDFQKPSANDTRTFYEVSGVTSESSEVEAEGSGGAITASVRGKSRQGPVRTLRSIENGVRGCYGDVLSQRSTSNTERVAPTFNELGTANIGFSEVLCTDCRYKHTASYDIPNAFSINMTNSLSASFRGDAYFGDTRRDRYSPRASVDRAQERDREKTPKSTIELYKYQELVEEWQFVAHVTDRLLFWLFLIVSVLSSVAILVIKPMFKPAIV